MTRRLLVDARLPMGSGIGRYVSNILPLIASLLPDVTIDVLVAAGDDEALIRHYVDGAANVTAIASRIVPFSIAEQVRLPTLAQRYDATWFSNYWVPLRWQRPFAVTVHDLLHLDRSRFPATLTRRSLSRLTFAKVRRDAAQVIFVSRFTERTFLQMVGRPRAHAVVHHGVDHLPEGRPDVVRQRQVVAIAAPKKHKNLELLLNAWAQLNPPNPWKLTLVAPSAPLRTSVDVLELARRLPQVVVRQGIGDAELSGLLASAAVVAVPSRYEGFGFPLLEGMLSGAQCISSTAEALVEIAAGSSVMFVSPDDCLGWQAALALAIEHREAGGRDRLLSCAADIALARGYTWARAAEQTAAALEQLFQ